MPPRPKVYINGRFLTQDLTGVQRYASEIVKAVDKLLAAQPADNQITCRIVAPIGADPSALGLKTIEFQTGGKSGGHLWEQIFLPRLTRDGILINLCNSGPIVHRHALTIIHDAIIYRMPQAFSRTYRFVHQNIGRWLGRHSRIGTVSHFSQGELAEVLGIARARISVIPNGSDHIAKVRPDGAVLKKFSLIKDRYFLFVGSPAPHKNLVTALAAFEKLTPGDMSFVVVGAAKAKVFGQGLQNVPANVILTGRLSDTEIASLYQNATAFIFPSLYEGFGIPPLEAMVHGCPVIASDIPSCREVCGDAAIYCDPKSPDNLARTMQAIIDDSALSQKFRDLGRERAEHFSWADSARKLFDQVFEV